MGISTGCAAELRSREVPASDDSECGPRSGFVGPGRQRTQEREKRVRDVGSMRKFRSDQTSEGCSATGQGWVDECMESWSWTGARTSRDECVVRSVWCQVSLRVDELGRTAFRCRGRRRS